MCDLDATVRALSHATREQLQEIGRTALQLGKDTAFSASAAAAGIEEIIRDGAGLRDAMQDAVRAAINLDDPDEDAHD